MHLYQRLRGLVHHVVDRLQHRRLFAAHAGPFARHRTAGLAEVVEHLRQPKGGDLPIPVLPLAARRHSSLHPGLVPGPGHIDHFALLPQRRQRRGHGGIAIHGDADRLVPVEFGAAGRRRNIAGRPRRSRSRGFTHQRIDTDPAGGIVRILRKGAQCAVRDDPIATRLRTDDFLRVHVLRGQRHQRQENPRYCRSQVRQNAPQPTATHGTALPAVP